MQYKHCIAANCIIQVTSLLGTPVPSNAIISTALKEILPCQVFVYTVRDMLIQFYGYFGVWCQYQEVSMLGARLMWSTTSLALHSYIIVSLAMDSLGKKNRSKVIQQNQIYCLFLFHAFFLSKPAAYISHNTTQPSVGWRFRCCACSS